MPIDAAAELGRNPVSTRFSLIMNMRRMARTRIAEPVSRVQILAANVVKKILFFPVQLTTSRIGNITRLIHTLLYVWP